MKKIWKLACYP